MQPTIAKDNEQNGCTNEALWIYLAEDGSEDGTITPTEKEADTIQPVPTEKDSGMIPPAPTEKEASMTQPPHIQKEATTI